MIVLDTNVVSEIIKPLPDASVIKGNPISQFDAMIASIVRAKGARLATRNTKDFKNTGITVINPWIY